jgi:hypothetical protein
MDWGGASKFARRYSSLGCQLLKDKRHGLKIDAHRMGLTEQVHPKISVLKLITHRPGEDIGWLK